MMFCPECGSLLKSKSERGKAVMFCSCGFSSKELDDAKIKEEVQESKQEVEVIDKEIETSPVVDAECDKCKNDKAYYWLVQTRAGDEAETKFMKCTKCGHTWRDYD